MASSDSYGARMKGRPLSEAIGDCLRITDAAAKVAAVSTLRKGLTSGELEHDTEAPVTPVDEPGRPPAPELVHPREVPQRRLSDAQGHAAFLHAVAHIEFTAINLALDAAHRFRGMPLEYYEDWIAVAEEEGLHFGLVCRHLEGLGYGYGDFPAHGAMWQTALATGHDVLARMAIVPRGLEARGLDVTPGMIQKLLAFGDEVGASILQRILDDEIGHVAVGTRWFNWCCGVNQVDPAQQFMACLERYLGNVRMPQPHIAARRQAGFSALELELLQGWISAR